ncbi:uncharacterized protein LOC131625585 [Vicia villosa]|uniref:uncharacterized protein LOC131625585 n=1 Tax=Vicia villosa TaxID=3911 RepID=UPI00273AB226|nr:uncharacterized protein LOC131625585 [Vicia villosa]
MEPAKIDWKNLEWNFAVDELYEHLNAPKYVDFLSLNHSINNNDDEAWFCKPDCNHPKTPEDFLRSPSPFKASRSPFYFSENFPSSDKSKRDMKLKRRVPPISSSSPQDDKFRFNIDSENQNPNLVTPQFKSTKALIKSSDEKKKPVDETLQENNAAVPSLKSTLSAKNLFSRRPILNQITEFCNELRRLAIRARERENTENTENLNPIEIKEEVVVHHEKTPPVKALAERKPLLEMGKAERLEGTCVKGKLNRKKRPDEAENMPITLDMENVRHNRDNILQQIRTNPPSPQCFSAGLTRPNPSKGSRSRLMERGILEEVEQNKDTAKDSLAQNNSKSITVNDGRETKALDMFWFFKPCTAMSS